MKSAGLGVAMLVLSGCGLRSSASFRYRMRVEGAHSGQAVYELLAERTYGPRLPDEKAGGSMIRGEALVVEMPSGPVFLLLTSANGGGDLEGAIVRALAPDIPWNGQPNFWKAVNRLAGAGDGKVNGELPRADWPLMVRFRDIRDPKTVEQVDPNAIGLRRIVLETTTDSVRIELNRKLVWLSSHIGSLVERPFDVPIGNMPRVQRLTVRDFSTETKR